VNASGASSSSKSGGLSTGAKAGIGIGISIFGVALIASLGTCFLRPRTQKHSKGIPNSGPSSPGSPYVAGLHTSPGMNEIGGCPIYELGMNENEIDGAPVNELGMNKVELQG
jgi:hypothetical protein